MTGSELYSMTASLGFEDGFENDRYFYNAANLALLALSRLLPPEGIAYFTPSEELRMFRFSALSDFFALAARPPMADGVALSYGTDYFYPTPDRICFSARVKGEVAVPYQRTARRIEADSADEQIDIAPELAGVLPLYTAAYIWLDDEPERAAHYMNLCREEAGLALRERRRFESPHPIENLNGW